MNCGRTAGECVYSKRGKRYQTDSRRDQCAQGREAGICGRHDLKERKAVRRDAAIQCGTQGTGIYLPGKSGIQPAEPGRRTTFPKPDQDAQRRAYHSCGRHETYRRSPVLLFCHFGQSNRTTAIHTTQSGKRRNIYPERDLQRTTDS